MFTSFDDMWTNDFADMLQWMDTLRRQMDRVFDAHSNGGYRKLTMSSFPHTNLRDTGTAFVVTAEVPGLSDKDIEVSLNQEVLTVAGERKVTVPESYKTHRQERESVSFSRSFTFPSKIDPEKAKATVRDGFLTIEVAKAPETQPRQITVKTS